MAAQAELVLATRNEGKIREFQRMLTPLAVRVIPALVAGLGDGPEETGSSYEENALLKAAQAAHATGLPALADDSGLEVAALSGAPGVHSARFGGRLSDGERIAHLLERIRKVPPEERGARFVCVLVLARPDGGVISFRGDCEGVLLQGPRGEGGHGYDPIFWSKDLGKTFAEASEEEKSQVSHRGRAARELIAYLEREPRWLQPGAAADEQGG